MASYNSDAFFNAAASNDTPAAAYFNAESSYNAPAAASLNADSSSDAPAAASSEQAASNVDVTGTKQASSAHARIGQPLAACLGLRREGRAAVERLVSTLYNHFSLVDLDDIDEAMLSGEPIVAFEHKRRVAFADAHHTIDDAGHIQIST